MRNSRSLAAYGAPLLVGAAFVVCSLGVYPLMQTFSPNKTGALLVYSCMGVIAAAAALLAICAVLWPRPFWLRVLISFSAGLILFGFWVIGFAISLASRRGSQVDDEWRSCAIALFCLPLVFLAIQSPLWLVRIVCRWELALLNPSGHFRPLTIRDILIAMGFIGIGLAGARFAKPLAEQNGTSSEVEFWIRTGAGLAFCIGISVASTLPIVVATLRARKPARAMLGVGIYAAIVLVIAFIAFGIMGRRVPPLWAVVCISTTAATFTAGMATPLMMMRRHGYRLRWGRESTGGPQTSSRELK